jgi:penicillin-binding protein 2
MAVVVEHGTFGARAAAPIAKDVMTFLFDPTQAWDTLLALEKGWAGKPQQRMAAKYSAFVSRNGGTAPPSPLPSESASASPSATPTPGPSPKASATAIPEAIAVPAAAPAPPTAPSPSPSPGASPQP